MGFEHQHLRTSSTAILTAGVTVLQKPQHNQLPSTFKASCTSPFYATFLLTLCHPAVSQPACAEPNLTAVDLQALGKVMGSELPHLPGGADTVLYPASVKASTDLQDSLAAAGFKVTRINTYNTVRGLASSTECRVAAAV